MPKHRKFLKSEKAKIKLKGATLPKGLNITKTDFKVKKIVIRDQIKNTFSADGTIIRNIKEILLKLQHHNAAHRTEGLHYLKDLLANQPDETNKQLGTIIKGLAPLCLDIERDIRRECFKALNILLAATAPEILQPFFDILTTYLKCAMTHIQMNIQEDSLFLLDSLLLHSPMLVADNSDAIFSCFLDMISKLRIESKPERTLSINLGSKITSIKWRSKVLDRLLGMLKTMCHAQEIERQISRVEDTITCTTNQSNDAFTLKSNDDTIPKVSHMKNTVHFDVAKPMYFPLIRHHLNQNCELPIFFRKSNGLDIATGISGRNDSEKIQHYTELLMPLIFETWMEVRPAKHSTTNDFNDDSMISNEAAFSLKVILEIVQNIHQLINATNSISVSDWFVATYNRSFLIHFLEAFPYNQKAMDKDGKSKTKGMPTMKDIDESGGLKCFHQNLMICHIFAFLNQTLNRNNQVAADKIIEFLKANISNPQLSNHDVLKTYLAVLHKLLLKNASNWLSTTPQLRQLLDAIIKHYQRNKFSKETRTKILTLLCDIVLNAKLTNLYGKDLFHAWLKSLPQLLCAPFISEHVIKTFCALGKQKNGIFMGSFSDNLPQITANLSTIQINGVDSHLEGQRAIVNLYFWLDSDDKIEMVLRITTDETVRNLINQMLALKRIYKDHKI